MGNSHDFLPFSVDHHFQLALANGCFWDHKILGLDSGPTVASEFLSQGDSEITADPITESERPCGQILFVIHICAISPSELSLGKILGGGE